MKEIFSRLTFILNEPECIISKLRYSSGVSEQLLFKVMADYYQVESKARTL